MKVRGENGSLLTVCLLTWLLSHVGAKCLKYFQKYHSCIHQLKASVARISSMHDLGQKWLFGMSVPAIFFKIFTHTHPHTSKMVCCHAFLGGSLLLYSSPHSLASICSLTSSKYCSLGTSSM